MKKPNPITRDYLRYISGLPKDKVEAAWDDLSDDELDQAYAILEEDLAEAFTNVLTDEDISEIIDQVAPYNSHKKETLH